MQSLYPSPSTYFTIARRILRKLLPCLKGSRGMMALMNSLLLISLAGSTQSQKTSLKGRSAPFGRGWPHPGIGRFASRSRDAPPRLGYRRLINHTAPDPASRLFPKRPPAFLPGPSKYIEWQTWRWAAPVCSRHGCAAHTGSLSLHYIFFFFLSPNYFYAQITYR